MDDIERIEKLLYHLRLNPNSLGKSIGLTGQSIYNILDGKYKISRNLIEKIIAKYNNISKMWLMTGEGEMLINKNEPIPDDPYSIISELKEENKMLLETNKTLSETIKFLATGRQSGEESKPGKIKGGESGSK